MLLQDLFKPGRNDEIEFAPFIPAFTFSPNPAAMHFDNIPRQSQAQSRAWYSRLAKSGDMV